MRAASFGGIPDWLDAAIAVEDIASSDRAGEVAIGESVGIVSTCFDSGRVTGVAGTSDFN
jgi:hypothetical protein